MRPQDEPTFEVEDEILADRVDRLEPASVELRRVDRGLRPRMRRFDLDRLADKHLQPPRRAVKRVAFGHYGRRTARLGPARNPASTRSGIASLSVTGSPSKRSTASRFAPPAFTCETSNARAGRSHSSSGSRSGSRERPPRS